MARITFSGSGLKSIGLAEEAAFSDDEKWKILSAGAEVLVAAHRRKLNEKFKRHSGKLAESPAVTKKYIDGNLVARVQPKGMRPGSKGIRKRSRASKAGTKYHKHNRSHRTKYESSNAEVAYLLEYGTPRIPATHWMEEANAEAVVDVLVAETSAWDKYLENKGF